MTWNEILDEGEQIRWDVPKVVEGTLLNFGDEEDATGRPIGVLRLNGDERFFYVPNQLKNLLERVAKGSEIRIQYLGTAMTKRGFMMKEFKVWTEDSRREKGVEK